MEQYAYKVGSFNGPLDLLLSLIAKNKIDIFDIPIVLILEQYNEYIECLQENKYEVTADFLAMAAELVYIKSRMLLPSEDEAAEEDPRERLVQMLLEYRRYKEITEDFARVSSGWVNSYTRLPTEIAPDNTYTRKHEPNELSEAYLRMFSAARKKAPPPVNSFKGIVGRQIASVSSKVISVLRQLIGRRTMQFKSIFRQSKSRSEIVATFLALLELSKVNRIKIDDAADDPAVTLVENKGKREKVRQNPTNMN